MSRGEAILALGAGGGRVVRRHESVVYISSEVDFESLVDRVRSVPARLPVREVVQTYVVEQGFDVPALVVIDWAADDVVIMLFGEIAVETSARTAPRLSSAGAGTWIEHRVRRSEAVTIKTAGIEKREYTDLELGLVPAGGFELQLAAVTTVERPDPEAMPTSDPTPETDRVATAPKVDAPLSDTSERDMGETVPHGSKIDDLDDVFDRATSAATVDRTVPRDQPSASDRISELFDSPAKGRLDTSRPATAPPVASGANELVEAQRCGCGALSSPTATRCRVCAEPAGDNPRLHAVERPRLAALRLPDGSTIGIESNMELGRDPAGREGFTAVRVDDAEGLVSSHHADLILESWEMFIVDRNSTNGTEVRLPSQAVIPLDPEVRFSIEVGSVLVLGGLEVEVVGNDQLGSV